MSLLNPYCSVQQVRDYIRNQEADIESQLEDAINAASRFIDEYKGRDYFEHDCMGDLNEVVLDRYDEGVFAGEFLFLPYRPVIEILEVKVCGTVWTAETDYRLKAEQGELISLEGYWIGKHKSRIPARIWLGAFRDGADAKVEIKGRFGYAQRSNDELDRTLVPDGLPANINSACVQIAASCSRQNRKDVVGLDGTKVSITETDIPKTAFQLLGTRSRLLC